MDNINNFESVILVDENDNEIGICEKLQAHKNPILHRAFSIFIFNNEGKLLLQKRNKDKYHSGSLWTNTCCSHPQKDTGLIYNASIRLAEEMGIICPLKHLFAFCYKSKLGDLYEYEYDHVLIGFCDSTPHVNKMEVSDWKWESLKTIRDQLKTNHEQYTYWFKNIIYNHYPILQNEINNYLERKSTNKDNDTFYFEQFQKEVGYIIRNEINIDYNLPEDLIASMKDCVQLNGKCKRSQMLYLCSKLINNANKKELAYVAASIELMQNASLIHDDIIDNGKTRRGCETLNKKYGSNVAIINGDFAIFNSYNILSHLFLFSKNKQHCIHLFKSLNTAYIDMCLGLRMEEKIIGNLSINENYYMKLIERKTASFFASVCSSGAILANGSKENVQLLQQFGHLYGLAYQIKDDLIPFISNSKIDKDMDADIKNRMMTLPYIYCYNELSEQNQLLMRSYFEKKQTVESNQIYNLVNSTTAINKCLILVVKYVYNALNILENFKDSKAKHELKQLTIKLLK